MNWQPMSTFNQEEMQFLLVWQDGAVRLHLWNPHKKIWEHGDPHLGAVKSTDSCSEPEYWMPLPDIEPEI